MKHMKQRRMKFGGLALCLGLCLLLCGLTVVAFATESETSAPCAAEGCGGTYQDGFCSVCGGYEEPTKDSSECYLIDNAGKLYWFAAYVNAGNTSANAKLTADITVNKNVLTSGALSSNSAAFKQWTPIGINGNEYTGTFSGNSHTVSGLYYNGNGREVGLFGYIANGAQLQNVGLIDTYFHVSNSSGFIYLGGISGRAYAGNSAVSISDCYSTAILTAETDSYSNAYVGGIVSYAATVESSITISGCYNTGNLTGASGGSYVGGIVGTVDAGSGSGSASIEIQKCYNTGALTAGPSTGSSAGSSSDFTSADAGGIVGYAAAYLAPVTIQNCFSTGNVTSTSSYSSYAGGVAGFASASGGKMTMQNCYGTGSITAVITPTGSSASPYAGGVAGFAIQQNENDFVFSNCYCQSGTPFFTTEDPSETPVTGTNVSVKTADAFTSGEVTWLLNGSTSEGNLVWKQTLDGTSYPGFTGPTVTYNAEGNTYSNLDFISVTVRWTSLEFTYTDGAWNTTTHSYETGTWSTEPDGGTIAVENHGNVAVTVSFTYGSGLQGLGVVSGSFTQQSFSIEANGSNSTQFTLSGKPRMDLNNVLLGDITVRIAKQNE